MSARIECRLGLWSLLFALCLCPRGLHADEGTPNAGFHSGDFSSAENCRECHPRQYLEWRGSTHAYAMVDPVFIACHRLAVDETDGEIGTECLECHSPIGVRSGELRAEFVESDLPPQVREGVTCEVCHRSKPPKSESPGDNADFEVKPGPAKFGNLYQPKFNTFHDSEASPFLRQSRSCGSCHDVRHRGRLVEGTFTEWKGSRFSGPSRVAECQDCHMLRYSGRAATNGPFREELRRHNFPGVALPLIPFPNRGYQREEIARFLRRSARISVDVPGSVEAGRVLTARVSVKNSGTGHNLPAASMRQMWLEVTVTDSEGRPVYRSGHRDELGDLMDHHSERQPGGDPDLVQFSDTHIDEEGNEVPYWRASDIRVGSLRPLETREATYSVPVSLQPESSLRIRVRLLLRPFAPYALRKLELNDLVPRLPVWEMASFDSGPLPVVREAPRRTEYRVPRDFTDLQEAIDALRDGDHIEVAPGEYVLKRPLDFRGKQVRLVSRAGPDSTVIRLELERPEATEEGSVIVFRRGEGPGARIEGFTITGGIGTLIDGRRHGGGIYIEGAGPIVTGNRVARNTALGGDGGGIFCGRGEAVISDNEIFACHAERGGGLALHASARRLVVVRGNSLQGNTARLGGGLYLSARGPVQLETCVVAGNKARDEGGGAFACDGVEMRLDHDTFAHNRAERRFGALRTRRHPETPVSNSIFWGNDPFDCRAAFTYSILEREAIGGTNLNSFPMFVDPAPPRFVEARTARHSARARPPSFESVVALAEGSGDYRLLPGSPAIDAGDPDRPADPDDTRPDIGALFLEQPLKGFLRGDVDSTGEVDWGDGLTLLRHLLTRLELPCRDAADFDDDGQVDLLDGVALARFLMAGRGAPAQPYPRCGLDPTFGEGLSCQDGSEACADPGG